ncbi:uncharacterized protein LOC128986901 isoform X2 [Macrosteles quadrilineatus]|uniref:uncharacterized protein LOC128986901 isoform X2 n=1 Tax=Macrosteles quadrilineatus TaxID=74068 RepID=UPI0023E0C60C|nr:uncharacterized protein LOC128986901 isoform X2 [Macrosteles quadrilineatus]
MGHEYVQDLLKVCKRSGVPCQGKCRPGAQRGLYDCVEMSRREDGEGDGEFVEVALAPPSLRLQMQGGSNWYKVTSVDEIFEIFTSVTGSYMLVGGNTSQGILKDKPLPDLFIDINGVGFLKAHSFYSGNLYVGANTTLADAIKLFKAVAEENPGYFSYTKVLAKHIEKVANTSVRNVGTIAGNLTIKHTWNAFPSDIFLILETVGALVSIRGDNEAITLLSLPAFLETNMYKKVILQIILPPLNSNFYEVRTYKITPRAQNAIAYVNAGFRFKVNKKDKFRVLDQPNIVFGGINPSFIHAYQTERFVSNKQLLDVATLQGALKTLASEVKPDYVLPDTKPEFRRKLTQSLLYRAILSLNPGMVSPKYRSGGEDITRPLSSGKQEFDSDTIMPPLYQPFPKLESLIQCSGEAEFVYDIPHTGEDLYCAMVITKEGPGTLESIDPAKALKMPGVLAFYSAKDIPGENNFIPPNPFTPSKEVLFADKIVQFAGQVVGLIVAQTQELADKAAELVSITITDKKKPVLDIRKVVKDKDLARILFVITKPAIPKLNVKKIVKGEWKMESQYHFTMETLTCLAVPVEDGLEVYCTSQWMMLAQEAIGQVLNIPENTIDMKLRRVGGGYGGKLTRGNVVGCVVSLAAHLLNRPVRMVTKLETVMEAIGKRYPCYFDYEVAVDNEGEIQYLHSNLYEDNGYALNDPLTLLFTFPSFASGYESTVWGTKMFDVFTDKPCNLWCRSPGTLESITMAEHIIEHIAHEIGKDPLSVRMKNIDKKYPLDKMIKQIKEKSDYDSRKASVEKFNEENVWKKRGITLVPMRFPMDTKGTYHAMVSVYRNDGTVSITHGGVEIGQGINTKAAQICAATFNIPLDMIKVKTTNTNIAPNNGPTAGSFTSESVVLAVQRSCEEINKRLAPIRATLVSPTWQALVQAAYLAQINLNATYMFSPLPTKDFKKYEIFGVTVLEVEVDILTGEHKIIRVDILEDAGKSFNPFVDIGQIEGSFVMGLGYWTSEEIIYDPHTGRNLTNRTLKYHIPGAKDIPIDFRTYILKNGDNPLGVLRSKATGEPPLCMSNAVLFAIRQALRSARKDLGLPDEWLDMDAPFTGEKILLSTGDDVDKYLL